MLKQIIPPYVFDEHFLGCCRCGTMTCIGLCGALQSFLNVKCLFPYTEPWPDLFSLAKHYQNCIIQEALQQNLNPILGDMYTQYLCLLDKPCFFIGMPIRRERVMQAGWHPVFLWEKAWRKQPVLKQKSSFVLSHLLSRRKQQSRISRFLRLQKQALIRIYQPPFSILNSESPGRIILLDDVLTTGNTATQIRQTLCEKTEPKWFNWEWELWTLFRAPSQAVLNKN